MSSHTIIRAKSLARLMFASCVAVLPFAFLAACDGDAEKAGEKIDEAIDDAGDAIEDATDKN